MTVATEVAFAAIRERLRVIGGTERDSELEEGLGDGLVGLGERAASDLLGRTRTLARDVELSLVDLGGEGRGGEWALVGGDA